MKYVIPILFLLLCINSAFTQENTFRIIPAQEILAENLYKSLSKIYSLDKNNIEISSNYILPWIQLESIPRKTIKKGFKQITNNFTINFKKNIIETKTEFSLDQDISSLLDFKIIGHTLYDDNGEGLQLKPYFDISNFNTKIDNLSNNFNITIENLIILNDNHTNVHGDLWIETRLVKEFEYVTISKSDTGKTFSFGNNKFKLLTFENGIATFRLFEKELNFQFIITNEKCNFLYTKYYNSFLIEELYDYYINNHKSITQDEFIKKYAELTTGLRLDDNSLNEILVISCGQLDYKIHFYKPVEYKTIVSKVKL